jgi:hypothetical protein
MSDGMSEMARELRKKSDEEWRVTTSILAGELQEKLNMSIEGGTMIDGMNEQMWDAAMQQIRTAKERSDGSSADYYKLPKLAAELQDLISAKNMNAQIGEIFRECYRYGQASHSDEVRGIKKILFYANAELKRLQNVTGNN